MEVVNSEGRLFLTLTRAALAVVGLCLLVFLVRRIGALTIAEMLRAVGWGFGLVAMIYAAHTALRGVALWQTLPYGAPRLGEVVRLRFGTEGLEMLTLTGPFVAEPAKGWLLHRMGVDTVHAFGAVAAEYFLYNLTAAWMAGASISLLLWRGALPGALRVPALVLVVAIALISAASLVVALTGVGLIAPALRALVGMAFPRHVAAVVARVEPIEAVLVSLLHDRPARLAAVLAVEGAGHALLALEIWVVLAALGFSGGWTAPVIVEGAVKFIGGVFFFVPGQIGISEGVYAVLMTALGLPAAAGVTIVLVRRARALAIGGVGFGLLLYHKKITTETQRHREDP